MHISEKKTAAQSSQYQSLVTTKGRQNILPQPLVFASTLMIQALVSTTTYMVV